MIMNVFVRNGCAKRLYLPVLVALFVVPAPGI
jgi:hypothetical protein